MSIPPAPLAPSVNPDMIHPSRVWYLLSISLFVLFAVPSAVALVAGVSGLREGLTRIEVPSQKILDLEPGTYTVFYEYISEVPSRSSRLPLDYPGMSISVSPSGEGSNIPVINVPRGFYYRVPGHAGYSVAEFEITKRGEYFFNAIYYLDTQESEPLVLALGRDKVKSTVRTALGVVGLSVGGFAAVVAAALILFLRFRNRRIVERAALPY